MDQLPLPVTYDITRDEGAKHVKSIIWISHTWFTLDNYIMLYRNIAAFLTHLS